MSVYMCPRDDPIFVCFFRFVSLAARRYRAFNEPVAATLPPPLSSLPLVVVPSAQSKHHHHPPSNQPLQHLHQLSSPARCYEKKSKCVMKNGALSILDALADRLGAGAGATLGQQTQQQLQFQKEQQARCAIYCLVVVCGGGGDDGGRSRGAA